jgi:hypothetical protein
MENPPKFRKWHAEKNGAIANAVGAAAHEKWRRNVVAKALKFREGTNPKALRDARIATAIRRLQYKQEKP